MAERDELAPAGVDTGTPSIARIYDYLLNGKDNFACDRVIGDKLLATAPDVADMARDNRAFLGRVVRYLAEQGIRQFIDIGTGLPTQNNVHEVAQSVAPDAKVIYVDNDPIVLVHARALLAEDHRTVVVPGDLRRPDALLADPDVRGLIDFNAPVALLLIGILYFFVEEDRPFELVATLRDALPPGSYLALSHVVSDGHEHELTEAQELYRSFLKRDGDARRNSEQVRGFFGDFELIEPGLVDLRTWRSDQPGAGDGSGWFVGGVGRKRAEPGL